MIKNTAKPHQSQIRLRVLLEKRAERIDLEAKESSEKANIGKARKMVRFLLCKS